MKLFRNKLSKILKESNCVDKKKNETISTHNSRSTYSSNIFSKYDMQMAAKELIIQWIQQLPNIILKYKAWIFLN